MNDFITHYSLAAVVTELVSTFIFLWFFVTMVLNKPLITNKMDAKTDPTAKGAF